MAEAPFELEAQGEGTYLVSAPSLDDLVTFTLVMSAAAGASEGRLADDEPSVRATVRYLLAHQEAADLPEWIEIGDVVAAYPDAVEAIVGLRS